MLKNEFRQHQRILSKICNLVCLDSNEIDSTDFNTNDKLLKQLHLSWVCALALGLADKSDKSANNIQRIDEGHKKLLEVKQLSHLKNDPCGAIGTVTQCLD